MKKFMTLLLCFFVLPASAVHWQTLSPGLQYAKFSQSSFAGSSAIHAFRINLAKYHLQLVFAREQEKSLAYVRDLATSKSPVVAINGGFFTPQQRPLGLRINNGKQKSPLHKTSWWGVFYLKSNKPYITSLKNFKPTADIGFAIQAGPILLSNRKIPKLKTNLDERSAIGIDAAGRVLLVITDNAPLTTTQLATFMAKSEKKDGLGCVSAMNLDGGNSAQLYAKVGAFHLEVANFSRVADAIVVTQKRSK
jgi:uncharacterized protein YigE (DUF2233 family)